MTIGERIRQARDVKGLTQKQLGAISGTSEITIRQYELGKRQPRIEQLKAIAAALNVSTGFLLDGKKRIGDYCKEWKSDKASTLYMRIDSDLLDELEACAKMDNKSLEDEIEEILYWEIENRCEKWADEEHARMMQEWYNRHYTGPQKAPQSAPAPQEGSDTAPATDGPGVAPEGE